MVIFVLAIWERGKHARYAYRMALSMSWNEGRAFFFFLLVLSMAFGCVLVSAFVFWYSRRFSFIENFELHVLKL